MNLLQSFVQTSPELQALIALGVTAVVSFLLIQLTNLYPPLAEYLGQYKVQIITWLTGLVVSLIDSQLLNVPLLWEPVAVIVMQLIVAVFAVLYAFRLLANRGVKSLK